MLQHRSKRTGEHVVTIDAPYAELTSQQMLDWFSTEVASSACSFALVDHITSNTALCLPVEQLAKVCKSAKVPLIVDGAHSLLSSDINFSDLGEAGASVVHAIPLSFFFDLITLRVFFRPFIGLSLFF